MTARKIVDQLGQSQVSVTQGLLPGTQDRLGGRLACWRSSYGRTRRLWWPAPTGVAAVSRTAIMGLNGGGSCQPHSASIATSRFVARGGVEPPTFRFSGRAQPHIAVRRRSAQGLDLAISPTRAEKCRCRRYTRSYTFEGSGCAVTQGQAPGLPATLSRGPAEAPGSRAAGGRRAAMRSTLDAGGAGPEARAARARTQPPFRNGNAGRHSTPCTSGGRR